MDATARAARRQHWQEQVAAWNRSGLSKAAFCREHGLRIWQFHYWCGALRPGPGEGAGGFAQVHVSGAARSGLRLHIGSLAVEVEAGFDAGTLKRLLQALGAAC